MNQTSEFYKSDEELNGSRSTMDVESKETIYKEVKDINGNVIGNVKNLIRNDLGETAAFFFKDTLGLGKKCYLIPYDNFEKAADSEDLLVTTDFNHLRNAPSFNENDWPDNIYDYLKNTLAYWKTNG
jgi:hypothetical protein